MTETEVLCRETRQGWCDVHRSTWPSDEPECDQARAQESEER